MRAWAWVTEGVGQLIEGRSLPVSATAKYPSSSSAADIVLLLDACCPQILASTHHVGQAERRSTLHPKPVSMSK